MEPDVIGDAALAAGVAIHELTPVRVVPGRSVHGAHPGLRRVRSRAGPPMTVTARPRPLPWSGRRPSRPAGFLAACRSEWIKFRSLNSNRMALIGAALLTVAIGALLAMATSRHYHHGLEGGRVWDPTSVSLMGIGVAELALAVLGVMMVSAEYPTGLIWLTLTAVPQRGRVLAAKTAVLPW